MLLEISFILLSFFLVGLVLGSFATALTYRIPLGKGWGVSGVKDSQARRSSCPQCNHTLGIVDLIPVFSWLCQKGRCRYCRCAIPQSYLWIELITALLVCLVYLVCGVGGQALLIVVSIPFLVCLVAIDLKYKILPNQLVFIVGVLGVFYVLESFLWGGYSDMSWLIDHVLGLVLYPLLLWSVGKGASIVLKKDTLGFGDVKLFAVCGLWCGLSFLPVMLILSGVAGMVFSVVWKSLGRGEVFPFGPALILSLYVILLFQNKGGNFLSLIG